MVLSEKDPQYKQCSLTVMDNIADPGIHFDENGVSNYVHEFNAAFKKRVFQGEQGKKLIEKKIREIKKDGEGKQYDCIVGVSGGVDSTYVAYLAKQYNLRPLVVHFDNGWNSELAVKNIENIITTLGYELYTYVINWDEFRDLQRAFFKAGVVDIELLTDHAIISTLYKLARQYKIHYILAGNNIVTENILPKAWIWDKSDWLNIKTIHNQYGNAKLKTFPHMSFWRNLINTYFFKLESIHILDYFPYNKQEVKEVIKKELGWRDYGGKHYESIFTRFYQAYVLPVKFGIDKRKAHLSTLICSGQITKAQAEEELKEPLYEPAKLKEDKEFVLKKLGFSEQEFDQLMNTKPVPHQAYANYNGRHWKYYFKLLDSTRSFRRKYFSKVKPQFNP